MGRENNTRHGFIQHEQKDLKPKLLDQSFMKPPRYKHDKAPTYLGIAHLSPEVIATAEEGKPVQICIWLHAYPNGGSTCAFRIRPAKTREIAPPEDLDKTGMPWD